MRTRQKINGVLREWTNARIFRNNALKQITRAQIYTGGELKPFFIGADPLGFTFSPPFPFSLYTQSTANIPITALVSGGTSPYTYDWSVTASNTPQAPTLATPTSATVGVFASGLPTSGEQLFTVSLDCTVTDNFGISTTSSVIAIFQHLSFD